MIIFNRQTVCHHRNRVAAELKNYNFLFQETGERLCDRLDDVYRKFPTALDLGCRTGGLGRLLGTRGGIEVFIQSDISHSMIKLSGPQSLVADEEFLPFAPSSFDLVLSNLSLHWVNDLPGCLTQIRNILKKDGLFLATMLGGETLKELRHSLIKAEALIDGGLSNRISPFVDVKDAGNLLQRAGFSLPVADMETITISYSDPIKLMHDIRAMGESNALVESRKGFTSRNLFFEAARFYKEDFQGSDGRIPATFQVVGLSAWANQ